jgi:hypothetical protein
MSYLNIKKWPKKKRYVILGYLFIYLLFEILLSMRITVLAVYFLIIITQPWITISIYLTRGLPDEIRYSAYYFPTIRIISIFINLSILLYLTKTEKKENKK